MVKLTVLYGHPDDSDAFEEYYANTHLPLVEKMPNLQRYEAARIVATPDGSEPPYYQSSRVTMRTWSSWGAACPRRKDRLRPTTSRTSPLAERRSFSPRSTCKQRLTTRTLVGVPRTPTLETVWKLGWRGVNEARSLACNAKIRSPCPSMSACVAPLWCPSGLSRQSLSAPIALSASVGCLLCNVRYRVMQRRRCRCSG